MKEFSLGGTERLKSRTSLNLIFFKGKTLLHKPYAVVYRCTGYDPGAPVKAAFIVPSKKIRNASGRNRIKRMMREAYRKNKKGLYDKAVEKETGIEIALKYNGTTQPLKGETEEKIIVLLQRLIQKL